MILFPCVSRIIDDACCKTNIDFEILCSTSHQCVKWTEILCFWAFFSLDLALETDFQLHEVDTLSVNVQLLSLLTKHSLKTNKQTICIYAKYMQNNKYFLTSSTACQLRLIVNFNKWYWY